MISMKMQMQREIDALIREKNDLKLVLDRALDLAKTLKEKIQRMEHDRNREAILREINRDHKAILREIHKPDRFPVARVRLVNNEGLTRTKYHAGFDRWRVRGPGFALKVGDIVELEERLGRKPIGVIVDIASLNHKPNWQITKRVGQTGDDGSSWLPRSSERPCGCPMFDCSCTD